MNLLKFIYTLKQIKIILNEINLFGEITWINIVFEVLQ